MADFDGVSEPAVTIVEPEPAAASSEPQPAEPMRPEPVAASAPEETAAEAEKSARRRSTVREKVSFLSSAPPDTAPAMANTIEPSRPPRPLRRRKLRLREGEASDQPRKAGWWSRRFGGE